MKARRMKYTKKFEVSLAKLSESEKKVIGILQKVGDLVGQIYEKHELGKDGNSHFYPADATKEELQAAISQDDDMASDFTYIRRDDDGKLYAIPYEEACKKELNDIAELLEEAAEASDDEGLASYAESAARNLVSGNFDQVLFDYLKLENSRID
ncbi:hypothetical protein GF357_00845, partial [Candidatus Dojkabacteria bacterium]|nr:hypothetical protein [Candidatus Dojkabacteria bacterium]